MLSGDNGLLKRAGDARDDTIVGQEKESVELAYVSAAVKKLGSNVDKDDLQDELDISVGANKTTVTGSGTLKVKFEDTKNEYTVSQNGTVAKYEIIEPTDVYATVCANGTLLFSNNQSDINTYLSNNSTIIASGYEIKNIKDDIYYWNSDEDFKMPFWLDDNYSNIIKADILNTIVPKETMPINIWFSNLSNLNTIEHLNNLNTSCTTDMSYMFAGCSNLTSIDVSNFDTNNVTNLQGMFHNCSNLTSINLSSFNTSNVNNMAEMFYGCSGLTNLNISNFNTSNVTDMSNMFFLCSNLTNIALSNFDTKNVTNMAQMFGETKFTTLDLTNFDTNKLTTAYGMFYNCSDLRTIYTTTSFVVSGLR